jgi:hypothetical protein
VNESLTLRHFARSEFTRRSWPDTGAAVDWWPRMQTALLLKLDEYREQLDAPVIISPAAGALGRNLGASADSQHNIDRWGEVRAVDVFPQVSDMRAAYDLAFKLGFTGIGVYPDWQPRWGLHLDMRTDRQPSSPALWSARTIDGKQVYFGLDRAWAKS